MRRKLLQDAIADAKSIKEIAITNAKLALEESITPHLQSILSTKIQEMEDDELEEDIVEGNQEELDLEEILEKFENSDDLDEAKKDDDDKKEDTKKPAAKDEKADDKGDEKKDDAKDGAEDDENLDDELNIEDMTDEDLKGFIETVISGMVEAGELEAGEGLGAEAGGEELPGDEEDMELGFELEEDEEFSEEMKSQPTMCERKQIKTLQTDLRESIKTIKILKESLNDINLLNSKLLYTNKIFKSKNLTESQKLKVLGAFDKATTTKEAKLVYETISSSIKAKTKPLRENRGSASKLLGGRKPARKPIIEESAQVQRWQKLAGII